MKPGRLTTYISCLHQCASSSITTRYARLASISALCLLVLGCAVLAERQLNEQWGQPSIKQRLITTANGENLAFEYHRDVQPILDQRCVVCHACYDAPCQLKLNSYDGLDRGANKTQVYNGTRLLADQPSRLWVDAKSTLEWRQRDFFPVLNERTQTPEANLMGSTLYRMLKLKQEHPLPQADILGDDFDLGLERDQQCATIENFQDYEEQYPLWGMPYGLPGLAQSEHAILSNWLESGAPVTVGQTLHPQHEAIIRTWESFFNQPDSKAALVSRYIYEHLYLANLYFGDEHADSFNGRNRQFYKLVRSRTPSGQPLDEIASRRPFDHPGVDQFYYRLRPVEASIADKTHMPYRLDNARMTRWNALFFEVEYSVLELPDYAPRHSANPFRTFKALPAKSRYRFMLDEAQFTIMGYIKGPVCRGQVALNVIEDQFWVIFVDPEVEQMLYTSNLREDTIDNLNLPAGNESNALPTEIWTRYAHLQTQHMQDRLRYLKARYPDGARVSLQGIWDGDGTNPNAALTIFRHFDSATVVKGFKGPKPKTAWVITYSLLERIHYLLVAGFDVYGNIGHQLNTRLYMDFLRMEGESNFLLLLPEKSAEKELLHWYRGAEHKVGDYLQVLQESGLNQEAIAYQSDTPKLELYDKLIDYLGADIASTDIASTDSKSNHLESLRALQGEALSWLPETTFIQIIDKQGLLHAYTLLVNRAHTNVSSLFREQQRLIPSEHTVSLLPGLVGSYPNSFLIVPEQELPAFNKAISELHSEQDYRALKDAFGLRRSDPEFWRFSDWLHRWQYAEQAISAGIFDYNRLENR